MRLGSVAVLRCLSFLPLWLIVRDEAHPRYLSSNLFAHGPRRPLVSFSSWTCLKMPLPSFPPLPRQWVVWWAGVTQMWGRQTRDILTASEVESCREKASDAAGVCLSYTSISGSPFVLCWLHLCVHAFAFWVQRGKSKVIGLCGNGAIFVHMSVHFSEETQCTVAYMTPRLHGDLIRRCPTFVAAQLELLLLLALLESVARSDTSSPGTASFLCVPVVTIKSFHEDCDNNVIL